MAYKQLNSLQEAKRPVRIVHECSVEFLELRDSMDTMSQLCPILIQNNGYIIDGHRRFRAAHLLGWSEIDCTVCELDEPRELAAQIRLNSLTLDENRRAIIRLVEMNSLDTLDSVGYAIGRNIDWVAATLGLQTLSYTVRQSANKGLINVQAAMLLAKLPKGQQRTLLTDSIDIPDSELIPKLQTAVRHRYEKKLDTRALKRSKCDTPHLRSERAIQKEIEKPTDAMRLITKEDAESALDGWQLALRWALRLDTESFIIRRDELER